MELTALTHNPSIKGSLTLYGKTRTKNAASRPVSVSVKITIITVAYNSAATIYQTLLSVSKQCYHNIEHIVIDGGSTDETLQIVRSFPHVSKVISEKDSGIYDAMNKGIRLATGDVIGFLNSDDVYTHNEVICKVAEQFVTKKSDTLYGDLQYVDTKDEERVLRNWVSGRFKKESFKFGWMPPHPTFFVRRNVLEKVGGFNLALKSASDYELMLRILYKNNCSTTYLPEVMVKMRAGGASNGSIKKRLLANQEDRMAWKLNNLHPYFFTLYMKPLRKVAQYINKEQLKRVPVLNFIL